jgi:hypothetical protein
MKYKYDIGDMVRFTLTAYNSPKVYHGVISERWGGIDHYSGKVGVYKVCCLEKGMMQFSVSEILIIEKV